MRLPRLLIAAAFLGLMTDAHAQGADPVPAMATQCAACHGGAGVPTIPNVPVLWGQTEGYIYLQLKDFKSHARASPIMNGLAEPLSREDMFALAKYFTAKPWPNLAQPSASADMALTALTANSSIGCTGCHGANYQGNSAIPRLAGQKQAYLLESMQAFRTGSRANNPGMSDLMKATPEDSLVAMAAYLAGL